MKQKFSVSNYDDDSRFTIVNKRIFQGFGAEPLPGASSGLSAKGGAKLQRHGTGFFQALAQQILFRAPTDFFSAPGPAPINICINPYLFLYIAKIIIFKVYMNTFMTHIFELSDIIYRNVNLFKNKY